MTLYDRDNFCIRMCQPSDVECPICGDGFTNHWLAVCGPENVPVCELCAWEHATHLAGLAALSHAANEYFHDEYPPHVWERIEKRRNDPKRLHKELEEAHDVLCRRNGSILAELVTHEIEAALKRDDVAIKRNALKAFREMDTSPYADLDAEIPF